MRRLLPATGWVPKGTFQGHFSFHSMAGRDGCPRFTRNRPRVVAHVTVPGFEADETLEQDAQLVQHCLQGDGSAWEELVRRHSRRIFNICYRFTGNGTEAEYLSHDVFLRVYRTLVSYQSAHGGFATLVTSRTRNLLIGHYRRSKRGRATDSRGAKSPGVGNTESTPRPPD